MFRLEDLCATGLAPVELISCSLARSTGLAPYQHSTLLMGHKYLFCVCLFCGLYILKICKILLLAGRVSVQLWLHWFVNMWSTVRVYFMGIYLCGQLDIMDSQMCLRFSDRHVTWIRFGLWCKTRSGMWRWFCNLDRTTAATFVLWTVLKALS